MSEPAPPTSPRARLHLIYARAANGVIGREGALPWHLPEDLAHFKRTTLGCPVIMGRKTWDSLPPRFRPLPGRVNIVVTRDANWSAEGAQVAHSLEAARDLCPVGSDAWVIGGAQIYAQALPLASSVVVTEIAQAFEGDAYAPELGPEWHETRREAQVSVDDLPFDFVTYSRLRQPSQAPNHESAVTAQDRNHRIDNIEFNVSDIARSKAFYGAVFGWTFVAYGPTYTEFTDGRLTGGFTTGEAVQPGGPLVILYADDLADTQQRLQAVGARISRPVFAFPGGLRFHFVDPDGYELAVWSTH